MKKHQSMPWRDFEQFVKSVYDGLVDANIGHVFLKRQYKGRRSGYDHEIDVAIELQIAELFILVLVECKHYRRTVRTSDVLEFADRIEDIGANKGVIVTTHGFQKGAFKIADAHGIALVTILPIWRCSHVRRPMKRRYSELLSAICQPLGGVLVGFRVAAVNYRIKERLVATEAWDSIVKFLVDRDGDRGFNTYHDEVAAWQAVRERTRRSAWSFNRLEQERHAREPESEPHAFDDSGICSGCDCSAKAAAYFGWWSCKRRV